VYERPTLIDLRELVEVLTDMPDWQYMHHVNNGNNDFQNWIRDCLADKELARSIARVKKKDTLKKKIEDRIRELEAVQ
jgi:hypothetical protein